MSTMCAIFVRDILFRVWTLGEIMVTYLNQRKETSSSSSSSNRENASKDCSSNVVSFKKGDSKKEQARAKLLRAAQKIRW